jgi:SNF2 family DNA or RNA helicase
MHIPPRWKHQEEDLQKMLVLPRMLDFSDPGTGKTRTQVDLFAYRRNQGGKCALIICPKGVMRTAWLPDFNKYQPTMHCSISDAKNRATSFAILSDVTITNTDATTWIRDNTIGNKKKKIKGNIHLLDRFDTLIVDEITNFKHHTSARSKALAQIAPFFKYRYGLTGTPNSNHICDMWHQLFLIDDGERLGKNFYAFRSTTCTPKQVGPDARHIKWLEIDGMEESVGHLISDIVVRHPFDTCHDIPPNFMNPIVYDLPVSLQRIYDRFKEDAILEVQKGVQYITAVNAAALMTKLMQIAAGIVYDEDRSAVHINDYRSEILSDLIEQRQQSVVFFQWRHQRDAYIKMLNKRKITFGLIDGSTSSIKSSESVDRFQKGFYRIILAQPQAAAHGITLTKGTSTIWSGPTYNLEHFLQGNRRIYRAGQKFKTETVVIMAESTIEMKVYERLQEKNVKQINLLSFLEDL